jgi:hypothetical protein
MQAIEFDAVVQDQAIPLPSPALLAAGQTVRVIVMYEPKRDTDQAGPGDPILNLARHPRVLAGFAPMSRDAAHER